MYSSYHTNRMLDWAREAYARGVALERKYGYGVENKAFQRAEALLIDVIVENDAGMPPSAWTKVEGLMSGSLNDVKEAFKLLGDYAHKGKENARHVEASGGYTRGL